VKISRIENIALLSSFTLCSFCGLNAQVDSALAFFPLNTGDMWQYRYHFVNDCSGDEQSSYHIVEVVGDTLLATGYRYKIVTSNLPPSFPVGYLRVDSGSANVYQYLGSGDCLIDSLLATEGSWFFPNEYCWWATECVSFDNEIILGLQTVARHSVMSYVHGGEYDLAYGLGRTQYTTYVDGGCLPLLNSIYRDLVYARIDGVEYGTLVGVEEADNSAPASFKLEQNYPNPFNPKTEIRFQITENGFVSLRVYDVLGREVATLVNERKGSGTYTVTWNASGQASGLYYYRLISDELVETKKMVVLK
jgi:hypothetical protein